MSAPPPGPPPPDPPPPDGLEPLEDEPATPPRHLALYPLADLHPPRMDKVLKVWKTWFYESMSMLVVKNTQSFWEVET